MAQKILSFPGVLPSHALSSLKHRNFRLFWFSQMISLMGTWMQNMAQGWLVLSLTDSAFKLGLVTAVQFTPMLMFSLVAGAVADRLPKRRMLIVTQVSLMLLALILGILTVTNRVQYWHVIVLAGLLGTANAVDMPARQSFIVEMVGKADLMNAIALNSSIFNAARVVGPALAGLTIGWLGIGPCFLLNAASFLPIIISLMLIRTSPMGQKWEQPSEARLWENIREGLSYIGQTPLLFRTIILMALMSIFALNFNVLTPVLARDNLGQDAEGCGYLMSAIGIGALMGAVTLAMISHHGPRRKILLGGAVGLCTFEVLLALTTSYKWALLLLALTGWSMITFTASVNTTLQLNVPDHLRGRIMSVYALVFGGVLPIGSLFSGYVAQLWGAPRSLVLGALLGLFSVSSVVFLERREDSRNGSTSI
jgi:MFS family permease